MVVVVVFCLLTMSPDVFPEVALHQLHSAGWRGEA